jgi:hypothetical protein
MQRASSYTLLLRYRKTKTVSQCSLQEASSEDASRIVRHFEIGIIVHPVRRESARHSSTCKSAYQVRMKVRWRGEAHLVQLYNPIFVLDLSACILHAPKHCSSIRWANHHIDKRSSSVCCPFTPCICHNRVTARFTSAAALFKAEPRSSRMDGASLRPRIAGAVVKCTFPARSAGVLEVKKNMANFFLAASARLLSTANPARLPALRLREAPA